MPKETNRTSKPLILAIETSGRLGSVALALGEEILAEKQFTGPMRHSAEVFPAIVGLLEQFHKKPVDIEQVYVSVGPGSFTGLRIAVTIAKSLALTRQLANPLTGEVSPVEFNSAGRTKIVAIDTLDCIAANITSYVLRPASCDKNTQDASRGTQHAEWLAVILDAKRGQFFIAVYEKTQNTKHKTKDLIWKKTVSDCLMTADEFLEKFTNEVNPVALIGEGLVFYKDKFVASGIRVLDEKYWNPSAANVHKLGWQKALQGEFADPLTLVPNYLRGPDVKIKTKIKN